VDRTPLRFSRLRFLLVLQDRQVRLVAMVQTAAQDRQVPLDRQVLPDPPVPQVQTAQMEAMVQPAPQAQQGRQGRQDRVVQRVLLALPALKVPLAVQLSNMIFPQPLQKPTPARERLG